MVAWHVPAWASACICRFVMLAKGMRCVKSSAATTEYFCLVFWTVLKSIAPSCLSHHPSVWDVSGQTTWHSLSGPWHLQLIHKTDQKLITAQMHQHVLYYWQVCTLHCCLSATIPIEILTFPYPFSFSQGPLESWAHIRHMLPNIPDVRFIYKIEASRLLMEQAIITDISG